VNLSIGDNNSELMVDREYSDHISRLSSSIKSTVEDMPTQPILFVGSGISQRYIDAPSWGGLLQYLADECPEFDREVGYYQQKGVDESVIGTKLSEAYYEWAYDGGRDQFPEELYDQSKYSEDIFVKYYISQHLKDLTPDSVSDLPQKHQEEIEALQNIQPHAIITTNYDRVLELIFEDHDTLIGETVIQSSFQNIGEIFKIHGDVSDPQSIVFTEDDYEGFNETKKYLAAKLLTYFTEHPVLIVGYGVGDDNVQQILGDVDQVLSPENGIVDNMYFLKYEASEKLSERDFYDSQKKFDIVDDNHVVMNYVMSGDFKWVFEVFGSGGSLNVDLQLLRSVMSNTYDIVATKAPREEVKINYQNLRVAANSEEAMGTILGVSMMDDPPDINVLYRYRATDVANKLGYDTWHHAVYRIEDIEEETGIDIRETDNQYHIDIAFNRDEPQHRYSDAAVELLSKVEEGEEYELNLSEHDTVEENSEDQTAAAEGN